MYNFVFRLCIVLLLINFVLLLFKDENAKLKVPDNLKHLKELEEVLFKDVREAMQTYSLASDAFRG